MKTHFFEIAFRLGGRFTMFQAFFLKTGFHFQFPLLAKFRVWSFLKSNRSLTIKKFILHMTSYRRYWIHSVKTFVKTSRGFHSSCAFDQNPISVGTTWISNQYSYPTFCTFPFVMIMKHQELYRKLLRMEFWNHEELEIATVCTGSLQIVNDKSLACYIDRTALITNVALNSTVNTSPFFYDELLSPEVKWITTRANLLWFTPTLIIVYINFFQGYGEFVCGLSQRRLLPSPRQICLGSRTAFLLGSRRLFSGSRRLCPGPR